MITEQIERNLFDIYFKIRHLSGWVTHCKEAGFTEEELIHMEKLDDEFASYDPLKAIREWLKEIDSEISPDVFFSETDVEKLAHLRQIIFDGWLEIGNLLRDEIPLPLILIKKAGILKTEKLFSKIRARQIHKDMPTQSMELPEWQITKAREYPLSDLVAGELKQGRMKCPFHKGKDNNFMVKERGYCFVCGEWADSIKYLMEIEKYSFREAVLRLCQ